MINNLQTKMDFQDLFHRMFEPLKPYYSPGQALLKLGHTGTVYQAHTAGMEAFARPLWGVAAYFAGGGKDERMKNIYLDGFQNGTDPAHPEYWGGFHDYDQRFVEMAAIALGLLIAPEHLWTPLPDDAKQNLVTWLNGINGYECVHNNWQFFCVLVNIALSSLGRPYDKTRLKDSLDRIDSYYTGNGWYRDGAAGQTDYYIGFAMHFYGLLYARFMKDSDPVRSECYMARAKAFAGDFIYWFDDFGPAVPYGRSLTYRFAQAGFFSACVWAGVDAFPLSVMKGIIVRHLAYWMEKPIFERDGVLSLGYCYPNLHMCEEYNGPGSPYWSMKSFLLLALEDSHPFWSAKPDPMPVLEKIKSFSAIPMMAQRIGEQAVLYPSGNISGYRHQHMETKYSKFAYASQMGFHISLSHLSVKETAPDNMLAFDIDGHLFVRVLVRECSADGHSMTTKWSPHAGITVISTVTPVEKGHIRYHRIESAYDCHIYECGFSVPEFNEKNFVLHSDTSYAAASNNKWQCTVYPKQGEGTGIIIDAAPNTNLTAPRACIPAIQYPLRKGNNIIETVIELQPVIIEQEKK